MDAGDPARFGLLLRSRRLDAGLTQEELAQRSGLSARTVGHLERGSTGRPYLRTVAMLAVALGLDEAGRAQLAGAARPGDEPDMHQDAPRQLPPVGGGFVGREAELAALTRLLDQVGRPGGTVVVTAVGGIAGVGKTALAVRWAHRVAGRFPDGQLYVNLRGFGPGGPPVDPQAAIQGFLEALGVTPQQLPWRAEARAGLYRSLMAGRRMLVVLDNARDSEQVAGLLPGSSGCLALVTSRAPLTGLAAEGARLVALDVLSGGEARELLALRLGTARVAAEPEAVAQIVALTGRLPLALSIVAARAAGHPGYRLAALAGELADVRGRLDALGGGEVSADVRAAFSWSFEQLSPAAAGMFGLLGVHPGPEVSVAAAASLAAVSGGQARRALGELTAAGLLSEPQAGRYACHDLVRAYAAERGAARPGGARDMLAATRRMLDHYLHTALAARQHINPAVETPVMPPPGPGVSPEQIGGHAGAMDWFATECPVLMSVLSVAVRASLDAYAQQLPAVMSEYLSVSGQWQGWEEALRTSLAAAQRRGDLDGQGWAELNIGNALTHLGRIGEAPPHLEAARRLFVRSGDHAGRGNALCIMAVVHSEHRRFRQGLDHGRQSLAAYQEAGLLNGQAMALRVIGWALTELGRHEQALACCQQALDITTQTGDRAIAARIKDTFGLIYLNRGRYAQAVAYHLQALGESRELGHRWGEADALTRLGHAYLARGDNSLARQVWQEAIGILDDLCHPDADDIRTRLGNLGHPAAQPGAATS